MKGSFVKYAIVLLPMLFGAQGCKVQTGTIIFQTQCTVDGPNAGVCTVTGGGTITIGKNVSGVVADLSDLASIQDGSYALSLSAPSSVFSAASEAHVATTTISVTTDKGYSSSITLPLVPTLPAIGPVNTGDSVFSFNLPDTPAFDAWLQTVASNTTSTVTLSMSGALPVQVNSTPGALTIYTVLTSNSTGSLDIGDLTLFRTPPSKKCPGNPGCPVPPDQP